MLTDRYESRQRRAGEWLGHVAAAALAGVLLGCLTAYLAHFPRWGSLSHALGPWVALSFAVSFRRPRVVAMLNSVVAFAVAVAAFYLAAKVIHDVRWSELGSHMPLDLAKMRQWIVIAVPAGVVLGWLGSECVMDRRSGAAATAAPIGLLIGDSIYSLYSTTGFSVVALLDLACSVSIFVLATRRNRRPLQTLLWAAATSVAGFVVVAVATAF